MNRIIIAGNGFDLAHGLKTKYEDFINWYWKQCGYNLLHCSEKEMSDGLCSFKVKDRVNAFSWAMAFQGWRYQRNNPFVKWNEIDALNAAVNDRDYCDFSIMSPLFQRICKQMSFGWVDIENEYYSLLTEVKASFDKGFVKPDYKALNSQLDILRNKLIQYLKLECERSAPFIGNMHNIMYQPIKEREISVAYKKMQNENLIGDVKPNATMFLNFNYTKTPERYISESSNTFVNYIHGNIENPESVIFGYGDELDSSFKQLQDMNDNECLRHIKSIHYLESDNYRRMLEFVESGPFQVVIMGHSCGLSDRTMLNTLFEHANCVSIKPYYYVNEQGKDNYLDIVQNISRNFTNPQLMRDRVVNKTFCEPLPQVNKE
ncbi:MAG: hypothetical protein IJF06_06290 [Bacteroidaceae bacterium]|nr:hypothetical protein [Bacteroidaceae bacterium]